MKEMAEQSCDQKQETVCVLTPIGDMIITVCPNGLHRLSRKDLSSEPNINTKVQFKDEDFRPNNKTINDSINWLNDYFLFGQKSGVSVPKWCPTVTRSDFNLKVWTTLMNGTKFGQTISYSGLALSVGKPNASRAVGTAMRTNPFILMVPCHRVVKKDGTLGNYSAGNSLKEWLISFEKQFKH